MGARCLATGIHGAVHNVQINLKDVTDKTYIEEMTERIQDLALKADEGCSSVLNFLETRNE